MEYKTVSFYEYVEIENPEKLRRDIIKECKNLEVLGRILLGKEGINAAFCATKEHIEKFEHFIENSFPRTFFKEQEVENQVYEKLIVRIRQEITAFGNDVDLTKKAPYIEPEKLHSSLEKNESIILIDARNDFEYDAGRFKGAKHLNIKKFKDFAQKVEAIKNLKDKKIVTYCTGGIRCEKASAHLKEQGFTDVQQLHGGIVNYIDKYPQGFFEGACYVFDKRQSFNISGKILSHCDVCGDSNDTFINCHNLECDKLFISCPQCQKELNKCCSEMCKESPRQRKKKERFEILGKVTKYFRKPNVAEVMVKKSFGLHEKIIIKGKTSDFSVEIKELRNNDHDPIKEANEGMIVSFPVKERVRVNDLVIVKS